MIDCTIDADCPFMYFCNSKASCQHKPIFPLEWYTILFYLLIPIGAGFVNVAGKSMGLFKVIVMMNLLRFDSSRATALIQPTVAGAALSNVISSIFKKHPLRKTSLIDFDIILIIIPCSLLGSTLGSFLEKLIPELIKDIITFLFFMSFAYGFYKKSLTFKNTTPESNPPNTVQSISETLTEPLESSEQSSDLSQ